MVIVAHKVKASFISEVSKLLFLFYTQKSIVLIITKCFCWSPLIYIISSSIYSAMEKELLLEWYIKGIWGVHWQCFFLVFSDRLPWIFYYFCIFYFYLCHRIIWRICYVERGASVKHLIWYFFMDLNLCDCLEKTYSFGIS